MVVVGAVPDWFDFVTGISSPLSVVALLNALFPRTAISGDHFKVASVLISLALKFEKIDASFFPALHDPLARVAVDEVIVPALASNFALVADLERSRVIPLEDYGISGK